VDAQRCPTRTCEWDPVWEKNLCKHNEFKALETKGSWTRVWDLNLETNVSVREERRTSDRGGGYVKTKAETGIA
jgi:hypothetical protein